MYDVVAIGELLADIYEQADGSFIKKAGGAPCNALVMANNMGAKTAFIGKVGKDSFGKYLFEKIKSKGVDLKGLVLSEDYNTTLAFVSLNESNDRDFSFYRTHTADVMLTDDDIDYSIIDSTKAICFGSLSFTTEPVKTTTQNIIKYAKNKTKVIAYDINYRENLWHGEKSDNIKSLSYAIAYASVLKMSDEEAELLYNSSDYVEISNMLFKDNSYLQIVLVSLGEQGSFFATRFSNGIVSSIIVDVVDTTGAGDAFLGAFLSQLVKYNINDIVKDESSLRKILSRANMAAAINIQKIGAIDSMPLLEEILEIEENIN